MNMRATPAALMPAIHPVSLRVDTYLINLDRAPLRRFRMERLLVDIGLAFERVPAVDGAALGLPHPDFDEAAYLSRHGRRPNPFEIGCFLSHVECARRFLSGDAEFALILEDDLDFDDDLAEVLEAALQHQKRWDILRLSTVNTGKKHRVEPLTASRSLAIALTREKGSGAYLINRKAAGWIAGAMLPMRLPYDLAFDLEFDEGLSACFVDPLPVSQRADPCSQIQAGLSAYRLGRRRPWSVLPYRTAAELRRFARRFRRLAAWRMSGRERSVRLSD
ncbi:glycosyl transferase [Rhizobium leguminosarum bv. trifolii CB782]|uniref:Glycosyl transferase n=1 Tax=Rhizobium hidalgonense TaxID=1538159 RepID=A0A2A6K3J2_9HYPH|nr:glycosyltransferase family 25 protein [Rhizobium hidalgonense]AHG44433.1 glycosyl transferase [Rhizobium leguminosarum bv. trifolii CB782]EJC73833.1 glycosyltransferase involved in LPS biosynthesis [Rhizobium leguminosarum bv. trifolii WSM2012]MDR9777089.1 glycosyltransferase family 25 protein [Rhizobium hidalgonense]MDR9807918.1 glycosyltransferase family 25 protein [Rhizobium hidalgonense]MDR9813146.1 glycosyltransferase family 25 protein [Rhizobium hidalgonense]